MKVIANLVVRRCEPARAIGVGLLLRSIAAGIVAAALWAGAVYAQAQPNATIQGSVLDAKGHPLGNVPVRLEHAGSPSAETTTSADGRFAFGHVQPGDYTVIAERAAARTSMVVHAGQPESQHIELVMGGAGSASPSPAEAMEFADKPNFTIAAVTDWTAAGGHGSDAVLRTSETLNREALNLKPATPDKHLEPSTKEWKEQESALRAALANAPDQFEANHQMGEFYLRSDRFSEAAQSLNAAYKISPEDFENEYDLALALEGAGEFARAQQHAQKLLAGRDTADVHRLAGQIDEKLGDPLRAEHEFERAVREDPSEQNYFEWGSQLLLHRAVWQAKDVFAAGVKAFPKSERMLTALGAALFAGALYDEAAQRLCEASDLNPTDPEPYTFIGKVEISSPNPLPCVEQKLARFVAQRPEDPVANYFYAMTILKESGESTAPATLERVEGLLGKAVRSDPKCGDAWLELGVLRATRADYHKAIDFYMRAIDANPQLSQAHYRLGVAYDRIGDKQKAAEQFQLHAEIEKQQAALIEKQRREVKQFVVVVDGKQAGSTPK